MCVSSGPRLSRVKFGPFAARLRLTSCRRRRLARALAVAGVRRKRLGEGDHCHGNDLRQPHRAHPRATPPAPNTSALLLRKDRTPVLRARIDIARANHPQCRRRWRLSMKCKLSLPLALFANRTSSWTSSFVLTLAATTLPSAPPELRPERERQPKRKRKRDAGPRSFLDRRPIRLRVRVQ